MIKYIAVFLLLCSVFTKVTGQLYQGESAQVEFTSDAPLELIQASSKELRCIIDPEARAFAFRLRIRSFEGFNSALQLEHFNENYLESIKFPNATFEGKIIEKVDLKSPGTYEVRAKGKLTIHGITQERIIKSKVISDGNTLRISCSFSVPLSDHAIEIPRIVYQKIADEISVEIAATLLRNTP